MAGRPVLWHIPISHYSEKVRWALDLKGVEHVRRAPPGGLHMPVALALTRGRVKTFPVMSLDGRNVGDSTAIIAELERLFPDPPLYPEDPADLQRALELEEWFDEELGPHARLLAWHELIGDQEILEDLARKMIPGPPRLGAAAGRTFVKMRYRVADERRAEEARAAVVRAFEKLEEELRGGDHLAGGRFSVADLTAAALFYPIVLPPEGPRYVEEPPAPLARFRASLEDRPGFRWVEQIFRRHRR